MLAFEQLQTFVLVLIAICTFIGVISLAVNAVVRYWRFAHQQSDENTETLKNLETYLAADKRRIERLEENYEKNDAQNKLILRALNRMLTHEIDGNDVDQLKAIRDEIHNYLIEKK